MKGRAKSRTLDFASKVLGLRGKAQAFAGLWRFRMRIQRKAFRRVVSRFHPESGSAYLDPTNSTYRWSAMVIGMARVVALRTGPWRDGIREATTKVRGRKERPGFARR